MKISQTFNTAMMGLLGQHITSDSNQVWITKTHHRHCFPGSKPFSA